MADESGRNPDLEVVALGHGCYRVSDGTRQHLAYAAGPPEARWVFLDGRVYVIDARGTDLCRAGPPGPAAEAHGAGPFGPAARSRPHDEETALSSPMPATVASINVTPGQDVVQGDLLVMLEAMKMELPIKAPRNGRVKAVACQRGELVQPGVPLVELE